MGKVSSLALRVALAKRGAWTVGGLQKPGAGPRHPPTRCPEKAQDGHFPTKIPDPEGPGTARRVEQTATATCAGATDFIVSTEAVGSKR